MRWRGFCEELIEGAHALEIDLVATLGALLADTPHTRPVPVSGTRERCRRPQPQMNVESSRYEGPTGIVGVFGEACQTRRAARGLLLGRRPALRRPAAVPEGDAGAAAPRRGPARHRGAAGRPGRAFPRLGAPGRRTGRRRLRRRRVRPLAGISASPRPSFPKPAATRSPASSSATCAAVVPTDPVSGTRPATERDG